MGFLGKNFGRGADRAATADGPAKKAARTTRDQGNAAEDRALAHLLAARLMLVERNYRTPGRGGGEIDLIMRERDGTLVFVEVRSRAGRGFGGAGGSIGAIKQQRVVLAARHYLMRWPAPPPCRFDAVLVEGVGGGASIEWLRGAFDAG
ncbi:YraN family protein [Acidovorax sp. FG27]|uniref:YraN family protein n=1 Tax=Acidovorax sp. FG27 TaxID=3133652 RepID=UPI0030E9CF28